MAPSVSTLVPVLWILAMFHDRASSVNKGYGGALNAMAPHLINTAASLLTGAPVTDPETPHISLKIVPSKRIHLTPSEMNSLLFTIKQEIHRKVSQLEGIIPAFLRYEVLVDELIEKHYEDQKHLSAWALNQAPVYMPFRDTNKPASAAHEPTLQMAMKKMKEKVASQSRAESRAYAINAPKGVPSSELAAVSTA